MQFALVFVSRSFWIWAPLQLEIDWDGKILCCVVLSVLNLSKFIFYHILLLQSNP